MKLVFCLVCILLIVLLTKYKEHFNNDRGITPNKQTKPRVVVCLFGVIPRSIKYTWESINIHIIQKLKEKYSVDIYIFNLDVGDTKVDGVKLNKNDINIIPYDIKEEYNQHELDKTIDKLCSKIQCKFRNDYSKKLIRNALRQMYSEYRVGKFLEKNKIKYKLALVCGPDYYIATPLNLNHFDDCFKNDYIYTSQVNDGDGYTNGFYFGKCGSLLPLLKRYENIESYLPINKDYEYLVKKSLTNANIERKPTDIHFFKIRANKNVKWQGNRKRYPPNYIKNINNVNSVLAHLKLKLKTVS